MTRFPEIQTKDGSITVQKIKFNVTANNRTTTYVFMTPEKLQNLIRDNQSLGAFLSELARGATE